MSDWLDAEAHADRALELFERGRWADAEAELRKAISLNPDQAEWHFNLGLTLEQAGREEDALISYERAIDLMPDQPDPLVAAGVLANRRGHFERAIGWLERAIRIEPQFEEAYAHKIESHLRLGAHDDAETTFYMAQHALPEPSAQCLAVMAESLIQRRVFDRAEWCLKEALRLEPQMPRLRARLAALMAIAGKPQRALQLYLRELRDDPGSIDTLLEFGGLLHDLGRLPEAAEKYRRVLELEPANVDAHFRLGQVALAAHRFHQASLEFELVLKLDSNYPAIRCAMGEALLRRDRRNEARRYLLEEYALVTAEIREAAPAKSVESASANPTVPRPDLAGLASLLLELDEPARAAELFEYVLAGNESTELLRLLALARFQAGDRDGGIAASRRVLSMEPECIRSIHNLALAALQQHQLTSANGWIKRGLAINHHDDGLRRLRIRLWLAMAKDFVVRTVKTITGRRKAT